MNVGAKEMRSALDEQDVISFDMESLEDEENAQAQQDFKEIMEKRQAPVERTLDGDSADEVGR